MLLKFVDVFAIHCVTKGRPWSWTGSFRTLPDEWRATFLGPIQTTPFTNCRMERAHHDRGGFARSGGLRDIITGRTRPSYLVSYAKASHGGPGDLCHTQNADSMAESLQLNRSKSLASSLRSRL